MGKQIEMPVEEKENLILECLSGQLRIREAARRAGVGKSKKLFLPINGLWDFFTPAPIPLSSLISCTL